ncbi:MAG TPA: hypothetical protein VJP80_08115 [Candidatus Saccharimonadales bacterium]|nr:hypothetical protein [Candidatus Saccharimonadales bacterium]
MPANFDRTVELAGLLRVAEPVNIAPFDPYEVPGDPMEHLASRLLDYFGRIPFEDIP